MKAIACGGTTGKCLAPYVVDADGNMTTDGTMTYEWDGENRL